MLELLRLVRDLCQLRRGPQDMPHSVPLLLAAIGAIIAVEKATSLFVAERSGEVLGSLVAIALILALAFIALTTRGFGNRFVQTATALMINTFVFELLLFPPVIVTLQALPDTAAASPAAATHVGGGTLLAMLAIVALSLWKLVIDAHIIRHALETRFGIGVVIALAWSITAYTLQQSMLGPAH